jgi:hypothetical protein
MAITHSKHSIFKSPDIKNLNKYNVEEIQNWFKVLEYDNKVPIGWKTAKELSIKLCIPQRTLARFLNKGLQNKTIETKKFRIKNIRNELIPYYHIIK